MIALAFLQFTSVAMLGWIAAAAAPILIHLLTRKRFRKVTWAAMEYLLAAMKKNQRRIQLEQWLLLAVRTLILLLLALALADPVLTKSNVLNFGGTVPPTHYVFVLDATYSMDLRRDGVTRFEAAKEAIREAVENAAQGDGFSLVLIADPPRVIIGEPAFDQGDLLDELNSVNLTHGLGDLAATLTEVESIVQTAHKQHSRLAVTKVQFLGDLERNTWEAATSATIKSRLEKLASNAEVALFDVGMSEAKNAAVLNAEVREAPVTIDRPFTIQAEVASFGEGAKSEKLVTLLVDEEAVSQQSVTLDSGGRGTVAFTHRFTSPGDHAIEIRLADDALAIDNRRFVSVPVREALRVLCVYGRPNESHFVALALEPEQNASSRVEVEEVADTALLERDLNQYDAVFLVNVPQLDAEQAQVLRAYVQAGGGLVMFPGDLTNTAEFVVDESAADLLPATFEGLSATGEYRFAPLDYRHEIVAPFRGFEKAGLLTTPIWKYVKLKPVSDARAALTFDSGDPAIVEHRPGRGRVVLFATAASPESMDRTSDPPQPWTALPTWPSFPPLVQESLSLVARGREEGRNRLVGDSLSSRVANASPDTRLTMSIPKSDNRSSRPSTREIRLESEGDAWRWSFGDTFVAGVYELSLGSPVDRTERYAVNIDPKESSLERIDSAQLPEQLTATESQVTQGSVAGGLATTSFAWFRPLLALVLALVAVETFLARWFGGGRV